MIGIDGHVSFLPPKKKPYIHTIAAAQTAIHHQPSSQCRQASWVPPRQGRQPPSGRCALGLPPPSRLPPRCCRLPACASARPPWEVLPASALAGTRPPCPYRWTPSETQLSMLPACQPLPLHSARPGPACRCFFSPSLSSTVVIHAFIPVHRLGSSTLFGLAVRFQHVDLQSSYGGGASRIISLPISSRTYDLIFFLFFFFGGRKLTCPSMPIISAIRKTVKANHWRVSGPQHIL